MPKVKKIKRQSNVDYSTGPAFYAKSKSRQAVDKMYDAKGGNQSGLKSKLTMDSEGNYIRRSIDSSPADMSKGGKMKFNKKYTSGSSNVSERKRLMTEISNIYKKYRGTKDKREKNGFPPAVAARLKKLMAQRDKL
jgi:hypothetical protein